MYVLALSDYKQHAAAAGYKPAPSIRQVYQFLHTHYFKQKRQLIIAD